jgi:hypothetical protein
VALKTRQDELKNRIEEIKVETKYYQTKDLIEKYSIEEKAVENPPIVKKRTGSKQNSPSSQKPENKNNQLVSSKNPQVFVNHQRPFSPPPPPPQIVIPTPTWMDRFMDALIGDDSRNQKYALICSQCFNHNGLVPPEGFYNIRYRCPNCGFINKVEKSEQSEKTERIERIKEIKERADTKVESDKAVNDQ